MSDNRIIAAGGWCAPSEVLYDDIMNAEPATPEQLAAWEREERAEWQAAVAKRVEDTAQVMYDARAKALGRTTRLAWISVPEPDKVAMRAVARAVLDHVTPGWDKHMDFEDDD